MNVCQFSGRSTNAPGYYMGTRQNNHSLYLIPSYLDEIHKKSTGADGVSVAFLKQLCDAIWIPIVKLVNMSLSNRV